MFNFADSKHEDSKDSEACTRLYKFAGSENSPKALFGDEVRQLLHRL